MMRVKWHHLAKVAAAIALIWIMNVTLTSYTPDSRPSNQIKEEIVRLSESYVKQLARETSDTVDGPFAARFTGYDLKKTMAVVLEDMLRRIHTLETQVEELERNRSVARQPANPQRDTVVQVNWAPADPPQPNPIDMRPEHVAAPGAGLILGAQEDCSLTDAQRLVYPSCDGKVAWMRDHWRADNCYAEYGVDGSECSFRVYLSEVENWCPLIPGRTLRPRNITLSPEKAELRLSLDGLLTLLENPGDRPNYDWIRQRVRRMWPSWQQAGQQLAAQREASAAQAPPRRRVLVHLGLLSKKSGFKMAENSMKGGPLGELVQWSDIICCLYMLGHDLTVTSEFDQLSAARVGVAAQAQAGRPASCLPAHSLPSATLLFTDLVGWKQIKRKFARNRKQLGKLDRLPTAVSQCQIRERLPMDMIFSDIVGLTQFKRKVRAGYGKFSCLLRVIDSFGTEPAFNHDTFAKANRLKTQWGMQNLNPQQFFTMFPHSPDNSFMGFVVEKHLNDSEQGGAVSRADQAVVYGKAESFWAGKEEYLSVFKEFVDIHATVFQQSPSSSLLPSYVTNHGIMPGNQLHMLLQQSKLFIGLGFPYEGPAPLEAMALGNVFINPRFSPPHNSQNTKFFSDKPTRRKLTSQHPYAEDFIGSPHVRTVDMEKPGELRAAIRQALADINAGTVQPYLPYEYTQEGMLQRLSYYISKQDFCSNSPEPWIPSHAVSHVVSQPGESCKDACWRENRICEPSHFGKLNFAESVERLAGVKCDMTIHHDHILYPAYRSDTGQCVLQKEPLLFSCVGEDPLFTRLCPCRTYMPGQTALCQHCEDL